MRYHDTLDEVFKSASSVRVLRALFAFPPTDVSAREIARRAGISHPTASAVLDGLLDVGVVTVSGFDRATRYRLDDQTVLAELLAPLFAREASAFDELVSFLQHLLAAMPGVTDAYIFGSVARGDETARSDIDLAVLCDTAHERRIEEDIFDVVTAVRRRFGSQVNPIVRSGTIERLCQSRSQGHRLWRRIRDEGVRIMAPARKKIHA